ncbi:MAG: VanW family protein [Clostridia bacterium]|nr:VanW family protein [Clostridia bacterium]
MSASRSRQGATKKRRLSVVCIVIVAVVVFFATSFIKVLSYNKVYEGVYIEDLSVGGMTREELCKKISELVDFSEVFDITLSSGDVSQSISTLTLSPALDINKMADEAFSYGRTKKGLSRIGEINELKKSPVKVELAVTFNESALQKVVNTISAEAGATAVDNKIEFGENTLTITKGTKGKGFIYEDIKADVLNCLLNDKKAVSLKLCDIEPEEITVDFVKRHIEDEPLDATYTISDHRLIITQSNPGVKLDEKEVKRILNENKGSQTITIPAKITHPEVSTESLNESLISHKLGTYTTDFSTSSADRSYNIKLACSKIDGYVLAPGEEFSYNEVVGPRTVQAGFKMANVYVGNTVQPGIGGGICQVSSTLFNAAVYADLDITSRRNHTLTVAYVPGGRDATVSYGAVDFKFKNNYEKPILIRAECVGKKNVISIYGSDERPGREIKITSSKTGSSAPKVVRKEDPNLPEGEVLIESEGTYGSSYVTYKITYENGVEIKNEVLCKSVYQGKDRVEIVGIKKEDVTTHPEPTDETTPDKGSEPTSIPVISVTPTETPDSEEVTE